MKILIMILSMVCIIYPYEKKTGTVKPPIELDECPDGLTYREQIEYYEDLFMTAHIGKLYEYFDTWEYPIISWHYSGHYNGYEVQVEYLKNVTKDDYCNMINDSAWVPCFENKINMNYYSNLSRWKCNAPEVVKIDCWELGLEDPDNPYGELYTDHGIWTKIVYTYEDNTKDTVVSVVTGGCGGVTMNGEPIRPNNAKDTTIYIDGVPFRSCMVDGMILDGGCSENGYIGREGACFGSVDYDYNDPEINSHLINSCVKQEENQQLNNRTPNDTLYTNNTGNVTGQNYYEGINRLSSDIRQENSLNRKAISNLREQNRQSIESTNKNIDESNLHLESIGTQLEDIKSAIGKGIKDTGSIDTTGMLGGDYSIDTSYGTYGYADTGTIFQTYRNKYIDTTLEDTSDVDFDTSGINMAFNKYRVDIYKGDCGCNPEWFYVRNVPYVGDLQLDICQYDPAQYTKIPLKVLAIFLVLMFNIDALKRRLV